ncbi:MAG: MFS transporter [Solirubrobacterales bacterium]|nr:MFS transporter [Solirubrobacterales bacterium]MBV9367400.1 MFS transporter [Solirubrobacterales bacterium]MBV9684150.1 MFS transporter [Solirubrobacterales bacterium]MBV9807965.1 MFS transporter [Solirubrobacterales bacterium]
MDAQRTPRRAWLILALGILVYAVSVFHRASLGVAGVEAQHRFGITAAMLSLFSVLQLAVYAGMQVPVGVMLDRFGSRRLIVAGAGLMGLGQLVLAITHSVAAAVIGRVLVGAGDAMTFISVLRLIALWFAPRRVPLLTQSTGILGQVGQIVAAYPLVALLQGVGWTTSFLSAALIGLGVAALAGLALRDPPHHPAASRVRVSGAQVLSRLALAWREPGTRLGLWTHFATQFSGTVFALLWGYPFLVEGERRTPGEAALLLTLLVLVSMVIGPVLGHLAARWPYRRSIPVLTILSATVIAWTAVLAWPGRAPLWLLVLLVVVLASNGPGSLMAFDYARTENEAERIGSATGIVNVGGFVASLLTIALIGTVLSLSSGGGPGSYTLSDFKLAFCVQYAFWAIGVTGLLLSRRRLRAVRGVRLDPFPSAVVRAWRRRWAEAR